MPKRTTVTLDDDVAAKLDEEARKNGESIRETLNRVVRQGLHRPHKSAPTKPFKVKAFDLGLAEGIDWSDFDCIERLLDKVEGPLRK